MEQEEINYLKDWSRRMDKTFFLFEDKLLDELKEYVKSKEGANK